MKKIHYFLTEGIHQFINTENLKLKQKLNPEKPLLFQSNNKLLRRSKTPFLQNTTSNVSLEKLDDC